MKVFSLIPVVLSLSVAATALSTPMEAEHKYVGVKGCWMCHWKPELGAQYTSWEKSKHARAFHVLASDEAEAVAGSRGIDDPQESPECLRCHVTGHGADPSMFEITYAREQGVGCESCHGPGKDYAKSDVMRDPKRARDSGLIIPTKEVCEKCHNKDSPTFKGFDFEVMYKKIAHPKPSGNKSKSE